MSNDNTNDEKTEPTEEATTDDGSLLEKNLTRRTALIGAGLVGSAAASQSASGVDIEVNEPGAADNDNPPAQGDNPAEVLSLTLESDDVIVDVDGSGDIEKSYLDMGFPSTDPEVLPGDRVSNIEPEDRLVTTRMDSFDVNSDHIFQAPVFDSATNLQTYYPYGHAFGDGAPVGDLSDTLNPTIGIKVDSVGVGGSKSVSSISLSPPGSSTGTFGDRIRSNVDYSGSIPGDGFSATSSTVTFDDHRREVTLPNVANNGELRSDEANTLGLQQDFGSLGDGPEGVFFEAQPDGPFVIGDNFKPNVDPPSSTNTGTATFVSAETVGDIRDTTFQQQSADIVTSIIDLNSGPSEPAVIKGQVTSGGTPQEDVEVEVTFTGTSSPTVTRSVETDSDGRYRFTVESGNGPYEVEAEPGVSDGFGDGGGSPDDPASVTPGSGDVRVVDFTEESFTVTTPSASNLLVRLPVAGGDNPNQAVDLDVGAPLGINRETTGTGFTQTDDFTMLSTGSIIAGSSVGSQVDDEGAASAFVEAPDGDFFLEVVTDQQTKNQLTGTLPGSNPLTVEQLTLTDVPDEATTHPILLDNRDQILTQLEENINAETRGGANDVVVQDVGDVENINDGDGDIDGIVIRSGTEVNDAYDQSVAVSSVEISSLPGPAGNRGLFGSSPGTAHPETTDIVTALGLRDGTFNAVNADTVVSDDIYKAQADPIDAVTKNSAENEQLGDFEVTNNGISEGEDATERVESKEETRTNDLVYRDSLNSSAGSAQDLGPTGSPNESTAGRFGPNPSVTQFHDGFDILELREPVEETASADVPHNPRGLGPGETNIDVYYGDRFDGIRVKNEGNLEGDNIENVQLGVMEPGESNNINGEMWTVEKTIGDDGFDAQDTIYWFSREDLAEVSNLLDFVYFGDNTEDDNGSFEEEDPDEIVNENVTVDHTSELTVSINVVNANEVGSPDQFGDTALFEVMDLEETTPQVDGEFDTFTGDSTTSAESGLFFKGHGDRGDIAASAGVSGSASRVQLANLYEPSNEVVPVEYYYGDSEGEIEVDGLLDAIRDYRDSKIGVNRLLEVVGEFR